MTARVHKARSWPTLVTLAPLCLFSACAQPVVETAPAAVDLVWPTAPEAPRIRFLYEITKPGDSGIRAGLMRRIVGAIRGREDTQVRKPYGLAVDAGGRLYVVDNHYQAVHVFDAAENRYYRFPDRRPDDFINPVGIAVGGDGRIFVSDSVGGVVHIFSKLGREYSGSFGAELLQRPTGLTVNPRTMELLVLDTVDSSLFVFDEASQALKRIIGKAGDGEEWLFHAPTNIAVDANNRVFVSDSLNFRVQVLDAELNLVDSFGVPGKTPGSFSRPKGLAADSDGHIYVVDALFDNVQVFDANGELLLAFGGPGNGPGSFWLPNAIHIDTSDRIYVSDSYNSRVQVFQYLKPAEDML